MNSWKSWGICMSNKKTMVLQDCFSLRARIGWQGLRADEFLDYGPYLVTGTDFLNGKVNWDTCYHVTEERFKQDTGIQLHEHDLLVTKDGTIGKTAIVQNCPEKATLNSGVFVVRATNKSVVPAYLYYVLSSRDFEIFLANTLTGSTIKHLNQEHFYKFKFSAPEDTKEQAKIAEVLATVDEAIDITRRVIEKYKAIKAGLVQKLIGGTKKTTVGKVCKIIAGGTPSTADARFWNGDNVWLTPADLSKLTMPFIAMSTRTISDVGVKKATGKKIPAGSVILSNRAPVGYVAIPTVDFSCNQGCKGLICGEEIDALYLYYFLENSTSQLEKVSSGTTFLELPKKELERFELRLPATTAEQREIADQILAADEKMETEREYMSRMNDIKQGLMQDLLTQKVSVEPIM